VRGAFFIFQPTGFCTRGTRGSPGGGPQGGGGDGPPTPGFSVSLALTGTHKSFGPPWASCSGKPVFSGPTGDSQLGGGHFGAGPPRVVPAFQRGAPLTPLVWGRGPRLADGKKMFNGRWHDPRLSSFFPHRGGPPPPGLCLVAFFFSLFVPWGRVLKGKTGSLR